MEALEYHEDAVEMFLVKADAVVFDANFIAGRRALREAAATVVEASAGNLYDRWFVRTVELQRIADQVL